MNWAQVNFNSADYLRKSCTWVETIGGGVYAVSQMISTESFFPHCVLTHLMKSIVIDSKVTPFY